MSLTHGWIPLLVQLTAAVVLAAAIGWRTRRWRQLWLPAAVAVGLCVAALAYWYLGFAGWADEAAPPRLWVWLGLSGLAAAVLIVGWPASRWWRRAASVAAVPLCLAAAALAVNAWTGYFPTTASAWAGLRGTPTGEADHLDAGGLRLRHAMGYTNSVVAVKIPDTASGFPHRDELVYLPPAWFTSPQARLPVVMMVGGEFGHPADWLNAGGARQTMDAFAASHGGNAPVLVFVDDSGAFSNDTECVNGTRGNAADHLTKDVVPYIVSEFNVGADPANWGIVGWSSGGTCALLLTAKHPELFSAFVDIDGEPGPSAGTKAQTVARLFGGDADAWAAFDPATVIATHPDYRGVSGWFAASPGDRGAVAAELCQLAGSRGIDCSVVSTAGGHDYGSAATAFAAALPWLASAVHTPGAPAVALPGAPA